MSAHPRPGSAARSVLAGLLAAIVGAIGLYAVVTTAGAAGAPAAAAAAAEPQTWVVDAVDDGMGNRWVAQATGGSDLTIVAGDTVRWQAVVGTAGQGHDLTSTDDGTPWDPPVRESLAPGGDRETYSYTFDEPGTYTYICATHETAPMIGTITVLASAPPDNQAPTASPMVGLSSESAPTTASFMAHASDPDGDPLTYAWDFGDATDDSDRATVAEPTYYYRDPGTYTVTLDVSDGTATTVSELQVVVGDDEPPPSDDDALAVTASAAPAGGASREVVFGGEVTGGREYPSRGDFRPFADGLASFPDLRGTATLLRAPGSTTTSIDVTGLKPNVAHLVHVHERACSDGNGGAHFRFDTTQPFAEANEIWLPFTSDGEGRSGVQTELSGRRAGTDAVSIVIHDPDNSARRIGCVDLERDTSALTAVWTFGDGTTATGLHPVHVYGADGRYTATLTVDDGQAAPVSDTVDVVVDAAAPETRIAGGPSGAVRARSATFGLASDEAGSTFACRVDGAGWSPCGPTAAVGGLREGAHTLRVRATDPAGRTDATPAVRRWTVDVTRPQVRTTGPGAVTRDRTPTVGARVVERRSSVARRDVELRVDGRRVTGVRYDARTGRVAWTSRRPLSRAPHVVRLVVVDAAGNRASVTWRFRVR